MGKKAKADTRQKDIGAATGQDWCFGRAPYGARPGTVQAIRRTAEGGFKSCRKGGQQWSSARHGTNVH